MSSSTSPWYSGLAVKFKLIFQHPWTSKIFLIISLSITAAAFFISNNSIQKRAEESFTFRVREIHALIEKRMINYEQVLRAGVGYLSSSENVNRENWRIFANELRLIEDFPGIQGFGFSKVIKRSELKDHVRKIHNEGFKNYSVWPKGDRDFYTSIVYLEPFEGRNLRAFGYDMFSDPVRRAAMKYAMDTGKASMSKSVTLVQETGPETQNGFLLYLPIFKNNRSTKNFDERQGNLIGFVFSPFRVNDLMMGILGEKRDDIVFRIFDTENGKESRLMYQSHPESSLLPSPKFSQNVTFLFGGQSWIIQVHSTPSFVASTNSLQPWVIAIMGLIIDFMSYFSLTSFVRRHRDAQTMALEMTKELSQSRERFELAINGSQDGIWDWDVKKNEIYFSPKWKSMLGYQDDELPNTFATWDRLLHSDDRQRSYALIEKYFSGDISEYSVEHRLRHKDGTYRWILSRAVAIRDVDGSPLRMAGSHKDITEIKQNEALLTEARNQAISATKAKSDFLANMSHEIRTPLNGIVGISNLLINSELSAVQKEYLQTVLHCSAHLQMVVNDVLDLSKIEANKLDLDFSEVSLRELVMSVFQVHEQMALDRKIQFKVHFSQPEDLLFKGDFLRIRQVLINLVQNAIKFTEKGQVEIFVSFGEYLTNQTRIRFEIRDTGVGISENSIRNIFEPFEQGDSSVTRKYGGTGLGLSICKRLVSLMGGEIGVESHVGIGSKFYFTIPVSNEASSTSLLSKAAHQQPLRSLQRMKILVVEDQSINQIVITKALEMFGHEVVLAENGSVALKILENQKFHIVLMDCHMPVMDGYSTTQQMRLKGDSTPVIALTADVLLETQQKCRLSGMDDYLTKPIQLDVLFRTLETISARIPKRADNHFTPVEIIDQSAHEKLSALNSPGHNDFVIELVEDFLMKTPGKLKSIEQALGSGNIIMAGEIAHALKSVAAIVGAKLVEKSSTELERFANLQMSLECLEMSEKLKENFELTQHHFVKWLSSEKQKFTA